MKFSISSSLHPHAGFHTSSRSILRFDDTSSLERCTLHLYYDLPPLVFFDPFELSMRSSSYSFRHRGEVNLELPITAVARDNSELILNVTYTPGDQLVELEVPLHARYGEPNSVGFAEAIIPRPKGFFACSSSLNPDIPFSYSPLSTMDPHFAAFFDPEASKFIELIPTSDTIYDPLRVAVGTPSHLPIVEAGTSLCILGLFVYLTRVLWETHKRLSSRHQQTRSKSE